MVHMGLNVHTDFKMMCVLNEITACHRWCDVYVSICLEVLPQARTDGPTSQPNHFHMRWGWRGDTVSLFTYRLPEELSCGNVITDLASFPKYFGESKSMTLNAVFLKSDLGSRYLSDFFPRSVFWDMSTFKIFIVSFPLLFSDLALTSAVFWQFLGLRCHFVSCSSSPFASIQ